MNLIQRIDEARKALAGLFVPGLVVLAAGLRDGSDGATSITGAEWLEAVIASLVTGGLVYRLRNGRSDDRTTSTPEV